MNNAHQLRKRAQLTLRSRYTGSSWTRINGRSTKHQFLRALMTGVMIADGQAAHDVPIPIGSQSQADQHFGAGSELSRMFQAYYANNFANEVWGSAARGAHRRPICGRRPSAIDAQRQPRPGRCGSVHRRLAGQRHQHHDHRHRWRYLLKLIADQINNAYKWTATRRCRSPPLAQAGAVTLDLAIQSA